MPAGTQKPKSVWKQKFKKKTPAVRFLNGSERSPFMCLWQQKLCVARVVCLKFDVSYRNDVFLERSERDLAISDESLDFFLRQPRFR